MLQRTPVKKTIDLETYRNAFTFVEGTDEKVKKGSVIVTKRKSSSPNVIIEENKPIIIEKRIPYETVVEKEKIVEIPVEKVVEKNIFVSMNVPKRTKTKRKEKSERKSSSSLNFSRGGDIPWLI